MTLNPNDLRENILHTINVAMGDYARKPIAPEQEKQA